MHVGGSSAAARTWITRSMAGIMGLAMVVTTQLGVPAPALDVGSLPSGFENSYAEDYYRLLLKHTRWSESTWDEDAHHYELLDFNFVVVLGHAVLLRFGDYDEELAGVSRATLEERTLSTIRHFATTNRWAGGSE